MKKKRSKKNCINIRKGFCFIGSLSLVLILSLLLGGSITSTTSVQAAGTSESNPLYEISLQKYLEGSSTFPWDNSDTTAPYAYSNTSDVPRPNRVEMFADYYYNKINSEVASASGWPLLANKRMYNTDEYDVGHNDTSASSGNDLYLLEFSTANVVKKPNIDIKYSVYFLQKQNQGYLMRFTDAAELSKDSRDFLGRTDRNQELRKGELEMTTIQLPKNSIPVGIFVWQDGDDDDKCAWELSYLDMYKVDFISDVYRTTRDLDSYSETQRLDPAHNYRIFTGTRVGYIDSESINKKYMASTDGTQNTNGQYYEWLYPLTPAGNEEMSGYVLEVVTQADKKVSIDYELEMEAYRGAFVTLEYKYKNGMEGSRRIELNDYTFYNSHPFRAPEDYDSSFDFEYDWLTYTNYTNPIAQNYVSKNTEVFDTFTNLLWDRKHFPYNGRNFLESYDMADQEFWTLPQNQVYNFNKMNQFGAMMLGNYFDAFTMYSNYLKGYQAIQIPITLPADIEEFTIITSKPFKCYTNYFEGDPNKGAGIQSIRVIELSEPVYNNTGSLTTNGFFSPESVLGLRGKVIAETQGTSNNYQGMWTSNSTTNHKLINYSDENSIEVDTLSSDTFQGVTVTFSDTLGAGLDNLLADVVTKLPSTSNHYTTTEAMPYVFDTKKENTNLGAPLYNLLGGYYRDPLTLTVTYYDDFNDIREVDIPFVTAYLMQLIMDSKSIGNSNPESWIAGVFQQGQTVGLRLNLSEFKSLISVKLYYGYDEKNPLDKKLHSMEGDAYYDDNEEERIPLSYKLTDDPITIDNICFYDNVTHSNFYAKYNGTGLISTIETSLTPSSSWQTSSENGQKITEKNSFTAYKESREGSTVNMFEGGPIKDEYKDKYLIEISTLNNDIAGTTSNLTYQLHYTDIYGAPRNTTPENLHGAAKDFYGNSSRNLNVAGGLGFSVSEFQYKTQTIMHLSAGSQFCFVVELPNVQQFDAITLSTDGKDEWQPEQIRILKLTSLSERTATRATAFLGNMHAIEVPQDLIGNINPKLGQSTYRWDRTYTGTVLATATPNLLLHSGKTSAQVNFTIHKEDGTTVAPDTEIEDVKYLEKIPTTMTYEDTLMDLGLNVAKNTYQIHVDVANVSDAGSSNYFYFQLLFENGRSGLVLANQQLPSDSFRQGLTETFTIQTTQRYGDVKAVRIICEATASTASTFDKLNIDKITVTLNSQQGTGKSWIVDRVGWIDINYVDEIQQTYATDENVVLDNKDLTLDFPVTSISSATELMFIITTGAPSDSTSTNLNMTSLGNNLEGVITYTDFQNTTRTVNIDIPKKIMDFNENESTSRILRSGTMDRFVISLTDVKQIDSFIITRNEGKNADWLIKDISINKVGGVGDVYLSAYTGEYTRTIAHSEFLTTTTTKDVAIGLNDSKTFYFQPHSIEADISSEDNNAWNTTITRYPISSDESLNIYVYLNDADGQPYQLSPGDNVDASIIYSSSLGTGALKASFKNIRAQAATETSTVLFAQNLSIQSVGNLKSMEIRGNFAKLEPRVRCVYIEHVQGNVIKDTLYVPFNNASLQLDKVSADISSLEALTPMKQIVRLQPKENTSALLTPESSDIAVALRYTSSLDPEKTKMVYQSPYVFLTDADYTILDNREHIEVPFYISGIGEIVGLTVISNGPNVSFDNALITNYPKPSKTNGEENEVTTLLGSCSIAENFVSTNIISKMMKTAKKVTPVTFTFTTPKEDLVAGCGTSGQVGMLITYTDSANKQQTYRINNILDYLPLDNPPFPDTVTSFNILMTDVAYLNSITLTPATDDWFLTEVNAKVTTYDNAKQTTVNKTAVVNQWAKADGPLTIDMRPDSVNTDGPVVNKITGFSISASTQQSKVSAAATAGNSLTMKVVAGDMITFTPTFQKVGNPTANVNWTAYKYDQFFTDYNDGSATFAVPTEDMIANDGLPKQYTLSAVCSENNSLAIPITIDVVSQEELDMAKENTAKLTLMTIQGNQTISTATYNESDDIELKVPAVRANGTLETTEAITFKFMASLSKESALFNVNDSNRLISPASDGTYVLTVPNGTSEEGCKDYYLMFNVADAETETTYTITVSVVLDEQVQQTTGQTMTVELLSGADNNASTSVGTKTFTGNTATNTLTYNNASVGDILSYRLDVPPNATCSVKADTSSYADVMGFTSLDTATGVLITIPSLDVIYANLGDNVSVSNGTVTVPFVYDVTVTIPEHEENGVPIDEKVIKGQIVINVNYTNTKELIMVLKSNGTDLASNAFTPFNTSYTSYSGITEGDVVTMDLSSTSTSNITKATLKADNDYAKAVIATPNDVVWSNKSLGTDHEVFTVPTYQNIATHLSDAEKQSYEASAVTIDYVFKLIADDAMTNTITIRVTYTKPSRASFSLRRPTDTAPTEETSLPTSAGVGDILN